MYTLAQLAERGAERFPDKDAFRFAGNGIDYATLAQRAGSLARTLADQGVGRRDRVGIFLHKSMESAIAVHGVLRSGAVYVPLDPLAPAERVARIVEDCGIRVLIAGRQQVGVISQLAQWSTPLECVIGVQADVEGLRLIDWSDVYTAPAALPADILEDDLAYIMYTSGSTGEPKGIMHTHRSGLSYARLAADTYGLHENDRLANIAPLHFDQSTFDFFSAPLVGATTVIVPEAYGKMPASLSQLVADERITVWYSVPFALIQLLLYGVPEQRDLSALRWILYGGEPFPAIHLRDLMKLLPRARFSNVFGPAEVNQCACFILTEPPSEGENISIGKTWGNTECLIVDEDDVSVPVGEVGELLIRSSTMMRGYWNKPDLNARAFFRRPSPGGGEDVFYRTGDLVVEKADGNMNFLGRKDRQVKSRGYRIELDEVEAALTAHELIEEAAVVTVPASEGHQQISAWVTVKPGADIEDKALRVHVAQRLPAYAVPATIEFVEEFPRTGSGKIDRRILQARKSSAVSAAQ